MFTKLMELMKGWLRKMVGYKSIKDALKIDINISDKMIKAIDEWYKVYTDNASWLTKDVISYGTASKACKELAKAVTVESKITILDPNIKSKTMDGTDEIGRDTRASWLQSIFNARVKKNLKVLVENGMAVGGIILKPYISNNELYIDNCIQGEFIPLSFNDEGRITEIVFPDTLIQGNKVYTRLEHHKLEGTTLVIVNKAYAVEKNLYSQGQLGIEINLKQIQLWSQIEPEVTIRDIDRPLYGFYKVPQANLIDRKSPLGVSVFASALNFIRKVDEQFSRLDWEYEAGEMALIVDTLALKETPDGNNHLPKHADRLIKSFEFGSHDEPVYKEYAPQLRDENFLNGLNRYLMNVEDACELGRGTLSEDTQNKVYTNEEHLIANKQTFYTSVALHQSSLEDCLNDLIYSLDVYGTLYGLAPEGDFQVFYEWDDSIIVNREKQLKEKMMLQQGGIVKPEEIRSWYTGESEEVALANIKQIQKQKSESLLNDIFTPNLDK